MSGGELAAVAGLGAVHGLNPAMGWLFAVFLGLQQRSRAALIGALAPIAAGHAAAVGLTVLLVEGSRSVVSEGAVRLAGAALLVAFATWKLLARRTHPRWVGLGIGRGELVAWSFLMSAAHGA